MSLISVFVVRAASHNSVLRRPEEAVRNLFLSQESLYAIWAHREIHICCPGNNGLVSHRPKQRSEGGSKGMALPLQKICHVREHARHLCIATVGMEIVAACSSARWHP